LRPVTVDTGVLEVVLQSGGGLWLMVAFLSLFIVIGLAISAAGLSPLCRYVSMKRLTPTDAYDIGSGTVEVEGEVLAGDRTLEAPLTGSECVAYEFAVERLGHANDDSGPHTKASGGKARPFRVTDATGTVGVDPTTDSLSLERDYRALVGRNETPDDCIEAFYEGRDELDHETGSSDLGALSLSPGKRHRFTERRIDLGQTVYVTGHADPTQGVAGETPTISDTGGDGGRLASLLAHPFVVADVGEGKSQRRSLLGGIGYVVFGLLVATLPSVMLYMLLVG
jgi:hypothetical protein